jgi:hypothetical protein
MSSRFLTLSCPYRFSTPTPNNTHTHTHTHTKSERQNQSQNHSALTNNKQETTNNPQRPAQVLVQVHTHTCTDKCQLTACLPACCIVKTLDIKHKTSPSCTHVCIYTYTPMPLLSAPHRTKRTKKMREETECAAQITPMPHDTCGWAWPCPSRDCQSGFSKECSVHLS